LNGRRRISSKFPHYFQGLLPSEGEDASPELFKVVDVLADLAEIAELLVVGLELPLEVAFGASIAKWSEASKPTHL
jgi:hypothetical protein